MKLLLTTILGVFFLSSCAHHHKGSAHHHHDNCNKNCSMEHNSKAMFKEHCAQSVSEGDLHVQGKKEFSLSHSGDTYYFSTEEKMKKFEAHIEKHIKSARKNWESSSSKR